MMGGPHTTVRSSIRVRGGTTHVTEAILMVDTKMDAVRAWPLEWRGILLEGSTIPSLEVK